MTKAISIKQAQDKIKKSFNPEKIFSNLMFGIFAGILLFFCIYNIDIYHTNKQSIKTEVIHWKKIANKYPYYPDAWAKLASLWFNLNEKELARLAINKAIKLDPVNQQIKNLNDQIK